MENQTSFDLNAAIQRWRNESATSSSFTAEDLDELESHVRDSESSLRACGLTPEESFLIAVRRIGSTEELDAEFRTINRTSVLLDRLVWMTTGAITVSALWSLTRTALFVAVYGTNGALLVLFAAVLGASALIFGLSKKKVIRTPAGFPIAFLLVSLSLVLLGSSLMDDRMLGPTADLSYAKKLFLYNLPFFVQFVVGVGVIALFGFKRPRRGLV